MKLFSNLIVVILGYIFIVILIISFIFAILFDYDKKQVNQVEKPISCTLICNPK